MKNKGIIPIPSLAACNFPSSLAATGRIQPPPMHPQVALDLLCHPPYRYHAPLSAAAARSHQPPACPSSPLVVSFAARLPCIVSSAPLLLSCRPPPDHLVLSLFPSPACLALSAPSFLLLCWPPPPIAFSAARLLCHLIVDCWHWCHSPCPTIAPCLIDAAIIIADPLLVMIKRRMTTRRGQTTKTRRLPPCRLFYPFRKVETLLMLVLTCVTYELITRLNEPKRRFANIKRYMGSIYSPMAFESSKNFIVDCQFLM